MGEVFLHRPHICTAALIRLISYIPHSNCSVRLSERVLIFPNPVIGVRVDICLGVVLFCCLSCMLPVEQIGPLVQWGEWVKEVKDIAAQFCVFYHSVKS